MANTKKQPASAASKSPDFITVKGKAMYARVFDPMNGPPSDPTQPPRWTVDVLVDRTQKALLVDKGIRVKDSNPKFDAYVAETGLVEQGYDGSYVTVRKSTIRKAYDPVLQAVKTDDAGKPIMEPAPRPKVTDSRGNEIPESSGLKIGNGSDIEVVGTITKPLMGRPGSYGVRLISTKVMNLVEYAPAPAGSYVFGSSSGTAPRIEEYESTLGPQVDMLDDDEAPF